MFEELCFCFLVVSKGGCRASGVGLMHGCSDSLVETYFTAVSQILRTLSMLLLWIAGIAFSSAAAISMRRLE